MIAAIPQATGVWRYQIHPEVWVLVIGLTVLYVWAVRVVGPKVVPAGEKVVSRRNLVCAVAGIVLLWLSSDWPMHDVGERYLYAVHMVQHTLITLVVPPLALLAVPRWLADLILGDGRVREVVRVASIPVVAAIGYNAMVIAGHWPALVNASVENGALHYLVHVLLVVTALLMWMPVCGPIEEWRMGTPGKMVYLFLMSVIPTVPGGWLTFAENAVYTSYDTATRAYGISVQDDQQAAGMFMKIFAGGWLWLLITALFFRWAIQHRREEEALDRASRNRPSGHADRADAANEDVPLTYDDVTAAFAESEAMPEPQRHRRA